MSQSVLPNFMRAAYNITAAERAIAVDNEFMIVDIENIELAEAQSENFPGNICIRDAINSGETVITDSISLRIDPKNAPKTNQVFPTLRAIVVIPVPGRGAVYLDQRIRSGIIIPKDMVAKLTQLAHQIGENPEDEITIDTMVDLYKQMV
jgi:hypothetical protein